MRVRGWRGWSAPETLRALRRGECTSDTCASRETDDMDEDTDTATACAFRDLGPDVPNSTRDRPNEPSSDSESSDDDICESSLDALDVRFYTPIFSRFSKATPISSSS